MHIWPKRTARTPTTKHDDHNDSNNTNNDDNNNDSNNDTTGDAGPCDAPCADHSSHSSVCRAVSRPEQVELRDCSC